MLPHFADTCHGIPLDAKFILLHFGGVVPSGSLQQSCELRQAHLGQKCYSELLQLAANLDLARHVCLLVFLDFLELRT